MKCPPSLSLSILPVRLSSLCYILCHFLSSSSLLPFVLLLFLSLSLEPCLCHFLSAAAVAPVSSSLCSLPLSRLVCSFTRPLLISLCRSLVLFLALSIILTPLSRKIHTHCTHTAHTHLTRMHTYTSLSFLRWTELIFPITTLQGPSQSQSEVCLG